MARPNHEDPLIAEMNKVSFVNLLPFVVNALGLRLALIITRI
jgi:hypothetical protein